MKYGQLKADKQTKSRRKGRGIAQGQGKTAGRGTKGQGSRKSGGVRPGFEGGQMPIYMRLPKMRGFKSSKKAVENVYTNDLENIKLTSIDSQVLADAGLISSPHASVKLLLKGELKSKKTVNIQAASKAAIKAIEGAGGSFNTVAQVGRTAKSSQTKESEL